VQGIHLNEEKWITTICTFSEMFLDKDIYEAMNVKERLSVDKEIIDNLNKILKIEANPRFQYP
jgi:hypothetical protein